jgi:hypothetical protein
MVSRFCFVKVLVGQSFSLSVDVSSIVESKSQGISFVRVSEFCGIKVSGCAVRIQAQLFGEFTLLLDFKCLIKNVNSLTTSVWRGRQLQGAENGTLYIKVAITKCELEK